jgi:glycosyltransferase involved in cell wall biosynthesis
MKAVKMFLNWLMPRFYPESNTIHLISLSCNTVPPKKYGGIELIVGNLAKGFAQRGLNVRVYSPGKLEIEGCEHSQTLEKPTSGVQQGAEANSVEHLRNIEAELRRHCVRGDMIIFNHSDHYRFLKKRLGRLFFYKVRTHEIAHWVDAGLYRNIIYPSESLRKFVKKKGTVIPHGVELVFSEEETERGEHLFYAGRITEDKGLEIALRACEAVGCRLRLAGPEAGTDFSSKIINHQSVDYLGELTYEQLFKEYQSARAFIYMTQYEEPFGLAVVEAMAAGCPVITTGRGGTGETVVDGKTGYFCQDCSEVVSAYNKVDSLGFSNIVSRSKRYTVGSMVSRYIKFIDTGKTYG